MATIDIACHRLFNQHLIAFEPKNPGEVVGRLGAMQAQDYLMALWAVGLRSGYATQKVVEKAIADRAIVRTWPLRGTLHFAAAEDVRWMLKLNAPRMISGSATRRQELGLDDATINRCRDILVKALQGGKQLSRSEVYAVLATAQISAAGGRGLHILSHLAHEGTLCFSGRAEKQPAFALLEEWLPPAHVLGREEALAELARRYFTSHGPATLVDFIWWSGLNISQARTALELAKPHLVQENINGQSCWLPQTAPAARDDAPIAHLLPAFDEYIVAYKDRSAVLDAAHAKNTISKNGMFSPTIVINGRVVGIWKRILRKGSVLVTLNPFFNLDDVQWEAVTQAAQRYAAYLEMTLELNIM